MFLVKKRQISKQRGNKLKLFCVNQHYASDSVKRVGIEQRTIL